MASCSESSIVSVEMWELSLELSGRAYFRSDLMAQPHQCNVLLLSETEAALGYARLDLLKRPLNKHTKPPRLLLCHHVVNMSIVHRVAIISEVPFSYISGFSTSFGFVSLCGLPWRYAYRKLNFLSFSL
jgi:hypothetical protein